MTTRLEIENNLSLRQIAVALEKAVAVLNLINENLNAIYNDPPYAPKKEPEGEKE